MRISVFGLGYVGTITVGCLAQDGHQVIGVDSIPAKVDLINTGVAPIIEEDIGPLVQRAVREQRLFATTDVSHAIAGSDLSLICVGTPGQANGRLDLSYVLRVCEQIGAELQHKAGRHVVVVRSTMLPGSMRDVIIPTLERASAKRAGADFGVCINPEFLREGTAVHDFYHPPKTVIGVLDHPSGDLVAELYRAIDAPMVRTDIETAEMLKYTDNAWHALKIGFANEIGNICKELGVDGHEVMDIFCKDTKLNLSAAYLKPGFAFGGSCLPKDIRALTYRARAMDLDVPILNSLLPSNERQIERGLRMIQSKEARRIGVLGFSFKAGTDDLRESPVVEVIERLLGKGYELRIYDRNVQLARLHGANRDYILNRVPHISRLMASLDEVIDFAQAVVIGNADPAFADVPKRLRADQTVVDFVRIMSGRTSANYDGICW